MIPPMATTGMSTAAQICLSVSKVMVELSLVAVANTANASKKLKDKQRYDRVQEHGGALASIVICDVSMFVVV